MKTNMYYFGFLLSLCLTIYVNAEDDAENQEEQPERRFIGMPMAGQKIKISKTIGNSAFSPYMNPMGFNPYGGFPMQPPLGMGMGLGGMGMGIGPMGMGMGPMGMGMGPMGMGMGPMGMGMGPMGMGGMGMGIPPFPPHGAPFGFGGMPPHYGGFGGFGMGPRVVHKVGMGFSGYTPNFMSNLPKDEEGK